MRESTGITQASEQPQLCELQSLLLHRLYLTNPVDDNRMVARVIT